MRFQEDSLKDKSPNHSPWNSKVDQTGCWKAITWEVAKEIKEKWLKILASLHFLEKEKWHIPEHTDLRNGCWGHSLPWDQDEVQRFFSGSPDSWGKTRFAWYPQYKGCGPLKNFLTVRIQEVIPVSLSLEYAEFVSHGEWLALLIPLCCNSA